jgi:hypothetical protein
LRATSNYRLQFVACFQGNWRTLLTNRLAASAAEVVELIDWYRARWEIEMLFNVLKNGCKVEELQLGTIERHYLPYFARTIKNILRLCDKQGVEHRTQMNQTPLVAAAAAGNVALIEALLERGADTSAIDHLGRNALHWAMATAFAIAHTPRHRLAPSTNWWHRPAST